jgi:hypothetical protein
MKNELFFLAVLTIVFPNLVPGQCLDQSAYSNRSGIVEYKFTGTQEGIGTLYFDDFGFRTYFLLDVMVAGRHTRTITITIGEDQYMFDADKSGEGIKLKTRANLVIEEQDSVIRNVYGKIGLEKTGSAFFMGKDCDLWQGKAGKVLLWNGIVLHKEIDLYGNRMHQEALSLKTDIAVDPDLFTIPENISFVEMPGRPGF